MTKKPKESKKTMQIYNTMGRELQEFKPIKKSEVKFYQCGPTVYWVQHIGNLRGMTMADLNRRALEYQGFSVDFVRNYTDVGHLTSDEDEGEDKMEKGAKREGLSPQEIAGKYIKVFEQDTKRLNIKEPDHKPRATEYIDEMIEMVEVLLEKGFAYVTPKAIYFDVSKFDSYTKLSRQKLDKTKKGAGSGDVTDFEKRNPQDFAVWFFKTGPHKNALQYWSSPFESPEVENGEGFPGWHLECSAMSRALLGKTIDIHMGGIEHIPVHHTNEIAQSEAVNDAKFVNYWIHNGHLQIDDKKISKSDGNFYILDDIIEHGLEPLALRYFFLNAHYRSNQNFTWDGLQASQNALDNLRKKVFELHKVSEFKKGQVIQEYKDRFVDFLRQDFSIPESLAVVWELLNDASKKNSENTNLKPSYVVATILDFDRVLGLGLEDYLNDAKNNQDNQASEFTEEELAEIEALIEKREQARSEKRWEEADRYRNELKEKYDVELQDTSDGVSFQKI
jgi:cysteinyl-tRNA synthetase